MSDRFPGGFITKDTPVTTQTSAPGVWTLDQAMQATKAGNWPVNGPFYVEDVFSTWLYTGNGSTQTIANGVDLAGKGGMTWIKDRGTTAGHGVIDTVRGAYTPIYTNLTQAQSNFSPYTISNFLSSGFIVVDDSAGSWGVNGTGNNYASWTFRKQPKFFDVVTWSGNGAASREISHALGSAPGCVIAKRTNNTSSWSVYHRGVTGTLYLNLTNAAGTVTDITAVSATTFTVDISRNASGSDYVAYLFAHDAGGFGLSGSDNVVSCGSFTTDSSSNVTVNLGYEPQWVLYKVSSASGYDWGIIDNMRAYSLTSGRPLNANTSAAESQAFNGTFAFFPTATGFQSAGGLPPSQTFIYIAIRRGPMKTPTTGTSVYSPFAYTGDGTADKVQSVGITPDVLLSKSRSGTGVSPVFIDRLRGNDQILQSGSTDATISNSWIDIVGTAANTVVTPTSASGNIAYTNASGATYIDWLFRRAPGFFDVVCYLGNNNSGGQSITHNLTVVPELIISKNRTVSGGWYVYAAPLGTSQTLQLNSTATPTGGIFNLPAAPTATTFGVRSLVNEDYNYIAYLFASCPGVSKVGSYTGTGTTQTINCGFTAGSRFVLIKRTNSTGDWYVWDSARGIVAGNDPYLLLNSTAAEVTNTDFIDTAATGFEISSTAPAAINASGGTFIFLAIA
jgi:hypothetical protein